MDSFQKVFKNYKPLIEGNQIEGKVFQKRKKRVNMPMPRFYFFFAGAFLTSFLAGFFATVITLGISYMSVVCIYNLPKLKMKNITKLNIALKN